MARPLKSLSVILTVAIAFLATEADARPKITVGKAASTYKNARNAADIMRDPSLSPAAITAMQDFARYNVNLLEVTGKIPELQIEIGGIVSSARSINSPNSKNTTGANLSEANAALAARSGDEWSRQFKAKLNHFNSQIEAIPLPVELKPILGKDGEDIDRFARLQKLNLIELTSILEKSSDSALDFLKSSAFNKPDLAHRAKSAVLRYEVSFHQKMASQHGATLRNLGVSSFSIPGVGVDLAKTNSIIMQIALAKHEGDLEPIHNLRVSAIETINGSLAKIDIIKRDNDIEYDLSKLDSSLINTTDRGKILETARSAKAKWQSVFEVMRQINSNKMLQVQALITGNTTETSNIGIREFELLSSYNALIIEASKLDSTLQSQIVEAIDKSTRQ